MRAERSHSGRRLAAELAAYLREIAKMRNHESNGLFAVSLATTPIVGWSPTPTSIDVVEKLGRRS
jgi:hypothetical protein